MALICAVVLKHINGQVREKDYSCGVIICLLIQIGTIQIT